MGGSDPIDSAAARSEGAAEERAAILTIVERYMRYLAHGHGATGQQVLEQIIDEIRRRGESGADAAG